MVLSSKWMRDSDRAVEKPKNKWAALTPSDTVDFTAVPDAIVCTSSDGGAFTAVDEDGTAVPFYTNPGQYHPIRPRRINATGLGVGVTFAGLYD